MPAKASDTPPRKALGRGLSALLPERPRSTQQAPQRLPEGDQVQNIPVDLIDPNPHQPRRTHRPETLEELAQSIRVDGVIQPIVVRSSGTRYSLVVGERRWRAAKLAGLAAIPAIVQEIEPERLLEVTLVENIQREDLNPIEIASTFQQMIKDLGLSHESLAARTGKNRTTITNALRLLRLPADVQELVAERKISTGHARALLALDDADEQRLLASKTAAQGLTVRQVERMVRNRNQPREANGEEKQIDPNVAAAIEQMERALGTKVRLHQRHENRGKIEIDYYSAEDLERIYQVIVGDEPAAQG